jgi:tRNA C32,U32 (ribose-2'-O)-methylase TrmJ
VDEIKDRYYTVAKAVLELRGQSDHQIVKKPFNFEQEVKRKINTEKLLMRTKEQHERERQLVGELKKLEQRIKKEEKEEKNFRKLIYDTSSFAIPPPNSSVIDADGQTAAIGEDGGQGGRKDRGSGVFLRS